ncbi:hypothetical protein LVD17_13850 [Fulvivirga ulvae]|uniref:hypothetical protein n=1 Tax=Fulvivirga ulvae TaxID=2904245 RepID=UPI001F20C48A|nr:hypothetical protein [Fulvivirga ulvae]UII34891.1 hypothetical protein LVD17_13850 [Fulvivirga ulvae]
MNECSIFDDNCDIETCEKFQDALIEVQLSYDNYPISLYKVQEAITYLEEVTGIKSNVNSYEIPVYSTKDEMLKDIQAWIKWFEENICKQPSKEGGSS